MHRSFFRAEMDRCFSCLDEPSCVSARQSYLAEARPFTMRIPSGRTKLCLAIDKVAFAWAMSALDPMDLHLGTVRRSYPGWPGRSRRD